LANCLTALQEAPCLDERGLLVFRRRARRRCYVNREKSRKGQAHQDLRYSDQGVMKHDKKVLTLPGVLHIMQYIQIVRQWYCIPACTFLRRSELRRTAEYATESVHGQGPAYRGSLEALSCCHIVQENLSVHRILLHSMERGAKGGVIGSIPICIACQLP
jgi:hypothetical protein